MIPVPKGFCGVNYSIKVTNGTVEHVLMVADADTKYVWTDGTFTIDAFKSTVNELPTLTQLEPRRNIATTGALINGEVWTIVEFTELPFVMTDALSFLKRRFGNQGRFSTLGVKRALASRNLWDAFKALLPASVMEDFMLAQYLSLNDPWFQQMLPTIQAFLGGNNISDTQLIAMLVEAQL